VQVPPFLYNPTGHVKTGKVNIMSEKAEISWAYIHKLEKHNLKMSMDSVKDCAWQWARREKKDIDNLSE